MLMGIVITPVNINMPRTVPIGSSASTKEIKIMKHTAFNINKATTSSIVTEKGNVHRINVAILDLSRYHRINNISIRANRTASNRIVKFSPSQHAIIATCPIKEPKNNVRI